jgi:metallo-beta-lactamase family protein
MLEIVFNGKKYVFTGDLGNSPSQFPDTDIISDADYMVMESCYGDRNHEGRVERWKELEAVIKSNMRMVEFNSSNFFS